MSPRLADALDRIRFARSYTLWMISDIPPADWFRMPAGGATHVAWQVGHLAIAQYRLCFMQLRGAKPEDGSFIPAGFLEPFLRESVPSPDPAAYPSVEMIRRVFDAVHARLLDQLPSYPDADLDSPVNVPHRLCKTKIDSLRWCSAHEMVHAGQIGLLRRLLGMKPLW
jgi:DinB superfamily